MRWLRRYQDSLRREQELAEEVEQLRSRAYKVTASLSGMPGGTSDGQSIPRAVEQILEAQHELEVQIEQCIVIRREVSEAIEKVTNPRDKEILRRRYILIQRWEFIAVEMHLEYRWVTRRHRHSIESMILTPENPI